MSERRSPGDALRAVGRELCDTSRRTSPPLRGARNRFLRQLPLVCAVFVAADLAAAGTIIIVDRLGLPWWAAALVAGAQALPLVLALFRPVAAWWLAFAASLPYAIGVAVVGTAAPAGVPWPWTEPGLIAYLGVTLLVACRVRVGVALAQWLLTLLLGGVLTAVLSPPSFVGDLLPLTVLQVCILAAAATLRGRSRTRRELREQEALTEFERTRRTLLEERTRIARELHDVVAHHMSVVAAQAEAAPYRVAEPPQELRDSFASIRENAVSALTELRQILGMLRSPDEKSDTRYAPQPTLESIDELVANVRAAGLRIDTVISGTERPVPQRVELSVFRIAQEALSNALRHSPGCRAEVELSYGPGDIGIRVVNSPAAPGAVRRKGTGHGVVGIWERTSMLGGSVRIGPREDGWFEVMASLPTREQE
ncbi:two-component sensor histidine kinase [Streptomyces sp. CB02923]|nr:two-component sensor histidine kinase [Streptomyces sp. CB02923]